jgi:hypothetical protein
VQLESVRERRERAGGQEFLQLVHRPQDLLVTGREVVRAIEVAEEEVDCCAVTRPTAEIRVGSCQAPRLVMGQRTDALLQPGIPLRLPPRGAVPLNEIGQLRSDFFPSG